MYRRVAGATWHQRVAPLRTHRAAAGSGSARNGDATPTSVSARIALAAADVKDGARRAGGRERR